MDMGTVVSFLGAASGGTFIGAIGGLITKFLEFKQQYKIEECKLAADKQRFEHEQKMQDLSNKAAELEMQYNMKAITTEADMVFDTNAHAALRASYEADKATFATGEKAKESGWFIFVDFVRGVTRPFLTWGLDLAALVIVGYLLWIFKDVLPTLAQEKGTQLLIDSVNGIMFLASTATTYWFASRGHSK